MIGQLPGVTAVQYTGTVSNANAYRSPLIPAIDTNGLTVEAASLGLPAAVGTSVAQGSYLNAATAREPVAVLGCEPQPSCWASTGSGPGSGSGSAASGSPWPASSTPPSWPRSSTPRSWSASPPPSDTSASTGTPRRSTSARQHQPAHRVDNLLAAQANPEDPSEVDVSQPSAALIAQADAAGAFNTLFLGLGAVALLVGAVGVANIMVISVLERRHEIGLRRALGATKGHIRIQFLSEAILLALAGGLAGVIAGAAATAVYAHTKGWAIVIPPEAWAGGLAAALSSAPSPGCCPPSAPPACPPPRRSGPCDRPIAGIWQPVCLMPHGGFSWRIISHAVARVRKRHELDTIYGDIVLRKPRKPRSRKINMSRAA